METFLRHVARFIHDHSVSNDRICVVLPNRRAGLFLKKELQTICENPQWSPSIFSIEDLFFEWSGLEKTDQAELLLELYQIVIQTPEHQSETFDNFIRWAPILLQDFNDADAWLASPKHLFTNLNEIKNIEHWSLGETDLSDFQKKYLKFWECLLPWYESLKDRMLQQGKAWSGLAARKVVEEIKSKPFRTDPFHFIFAGFNALNSAEERLFSVLADQGKADLLWDADRYYLEDPLNESGRFLRSYKGSLLRKYGTPADDFPHVHDLIATTKKNIHLIAAARNVSQARSVHHYLIHEGKDFVPEETAVILADEQLLIPVLNSIPSEFPDVNITMGYPIKSTPLYTLVQLIFSLQENRNRFNIKTSTGDWKFYHADITRLLRHPYIVGSAEDQSKLTEVVRTIGKRNITFISSPKLNDLAGRQILPDFIFTEWKSTEDILQTFSLLTDHLRAVFESEDRGNPIDLEFLYRFHLLLNRMKSLSPKWTAKEDTKAFRTMFLQLLSGLSVPFYGEPLKGLQVMGMLETRNLDFRNIIIVSANDNILPASSVQQTFILQELRKAFSLPLFRDRDAIAAYHFYRILQRAENICFIYNTDQDTFGAREKSRFITQLEHELPARNKNVKFSYSITGADTATAKEIKEIAIPATPESIDILLRKAEAGFSPSLINTFRECKLKFYLRYVAGLYEQQEVEETLDANTLGTLIHRMLEEIYKNFSDKKVDTGILAGQKNKCQDYANRFFRSMFGDEDPDTGKNLLAVKVAVRYVQTFIDLETDRIHKEQKRGIANHILGLEQELLVSTHISSHLVRFKGNADRIDKRNNDIRLIDYKTGDVQDKDVKLKEWDDFLSDKGSSKAFQLMMYAWLYHKTKRPAESITPCIISFRRIQQGELVLSLPESEVIDQKSLDKFESILTSLTEQILAPETVFDQTDNIKLCDSCDFNRLCNR